MSKKTEARLLALVRRLSAAGQKKLIQSMKKKAALPPGKERHSKKSKKLN
jgi:hypothetical protein